MAIILVFLALGAVIILFFGELMFTVAALALLTAFLICRLDLSGTWIDRAWIFVTAPPVTVPEALVWSGYIAFGALLFWAISAHLARPWKEARGLAATASEAPPIVDMADLERELLEAGPLVAVSGAPETALAS